ncbi:MAG TPA: hypothetical protein VND93_28455 [Myxococcales bacterium]|nr:hypothetical protein [Myxococcales bacterium]
MKKPTLAKLILAAAALALATGCPPAAPLITLFTAAPATISEGQTATLVFAAPEGISLSIDQGVGDVTGKTSIDVSPAATTTYTLTATNKDKKTEVGTVTVNVGPAPAVSFAVTGLDSAIAGVEGTATITVVTAAGVKIPGFRGTLHFASDDAQAVLPADRAFAAADNGSFTVPVTFKTAGTALLIASDTGNPALQGFRRIPVGPAAASSLSISADRTSVAAGDGVSLTVVAKDQFGNVAHGYRGTVSTSANYPGATLPATVTFDAADQGQKTFGASFPLVASWTVTVTDQASSALTATTPAIAVSHGPAAALELTGGGAATAGAAAGFTLTVRDRFGNVATGFTGTVSFTSSDANATLPASYTFVSGDSGAHTFSATFTTAGAQQLTASDGGGRLSSAVGHFTVGAAAASQCSLTGLPATAGAGAKLVPVVTFFDPFNNVATGYTGTVTLTTTAASAVLPPAAALGAGDAGSHAFQVQVLSTGPADVAAGDGAISCSGTVDITPAGPKYVVSLAAPDANASWAISGTVTVKDLYDNPITNYAGGLHFASTDAAGVAPADVTLDGSEGGVAAFSFTFNTAGFQSVLVTDPASAATPGSAAVNVHGLAYTNPTAGNGRVRVVMNAANTTSSVVQLDVVSNTFVARGSNGVYIRGGVFSTGMNLPLNATRVIAGTPLLSEPATLVIPTGSAPKAVASALPSSGPAAGTLLVALSGKRAGAGGTPNDANMVVGSLLYSVRLKIAQAATAGTVFDGSALPANFRAAVRSVNGDDLVGTQDFALGKLEVR